MLLQMDYCWVLSKVAKKALVSDKFISSLYMHMKFLTLNLLLIFKNYYLKKVLGPVGLEEAWDREFSSSQQWSFLECGQTDRHTHRENQYVFGP